MLVVRFDIALYISHDFAPFVRQVSRESRDEFGPGFAACAFGDGFVIHVFGGTLAAGLR
jgi:hypothetical protein